MVHCLRVAAQSLAMLRCLLCLLCCHLTHIHLLLNPRFLFIGGCFNLVQACDSNRQYIDRKLRQVLQVFALHAAPLNFRPSATASNQTHGAEQQGAWQHS